MSQNLIDTPPVSEFLDQRTTLSEKSLPMAFQKVRPTTSWSTFFSRCFALLFGLTKSGTSANRPTSGLWTGQPYFDTTLQCPLWLQSVSPILWMGRFQRHKPSPTSRTSNTTLADDPDLLFPVLANEEFLGRVYLDVGSSLTTTGIKVTIAAPSGATGHIVAQLINDAQSAQEADTIRTDTPGTALDFTTTIVGTALNGELQIIFHITNGSTAGNISVQWAQSTSSGTALTLRTGSHMTVDKTA